MINSPKASGYGRKPFSTHRHLESLPWPFFFCISLARRILPQATGCGELEAWMQLDVGRRRFIPLPWAGAGGGGGRAENTGMRFLLGVCWRMKEVCRANEAASALCASSRAPGVKSAGVFCGGKSSGAGVAPRRGMLELEKPWGLL